MAFNLYLIFFMIFGFWIMMNFLSPYLKDRGIEIVGFTLLWRTKKFMGIINDLSRKFGKFWDYFAKFGIIASLFGCSYILYFLFNKTLEMAQTSEPQRGATLVIPGVTIPLWYGLIGLITLIIAHEFAHGIIARRENIPLKSVGAGVFIALPLAFVEPEEEEMKKASPWARIKVYGAGSTANFVVGFIVLLLLFSLVIPRLPKTGVVIGFVNSDTPAEQAGLEEGMLIEALELKGITYDITNHNQFSFLMDETTPGEHIDIVTQKGTYTVTLAKHPEKDIGYIGIGPIDRAWIATPEIAEIVKNPEKLKNLLTSVEYLSPIVYPKTFSAVEWFLINSLLWIFLLNVNIGLINLLPIPPVLDGGKIVKELMEMKLSKKISNVISAFLAVISIFLMVIAFFPGLLEMLP